MHKRVLTVLLAGVVTAGTAHAEDKDLVKYREHIMEVIGGHMGSIAAIVKGKVPYKGDLAYHAEALAAAAPKVAPAFKTRAMTDKSESLPKIWDNWADFEKMAKKLETASAELSKAAAGGDMAAVGPALGAVGKACKGCHDEYTKEH